MHKKQRSKRRKQYDAEKIGVSLIKAWKIYLGHKLDIFYLNDYFKSIKITYASPISQKQGRNVRCPDFHNSQMKRILLGQACETFCQ